jgi:hypothetical protein
VRVGFIYYIVSKTRLTNNNTPIQFPDILKRNSNIGVINSGNSMTGSYDKLHNVHYTEAKLKSGKYSKNTYETLDPTYKSANKMKTRNPHDQNKSIKKRYYFVF